MYPLCPRANKCKIVQNLLSIASKLVSLCKFTDICAYQKCVPLIRNGGSGTNDIPTKILSWKCRWSALTLRNGAGRRINKLLLRQLQLLLLLNKCLMLEVEGKITYNHGGNIRPRSSSGEVTFE